MDFVIIANAWSAGIDNPTSKHQIAMELIRRGHNVLWVEGSGMRRPSLASGHDRARILRKIGMAFRGARQAGIAKSEGEGAEREEDGGPFDFAQGGQRTAAFAQKLRRAKEDRRQQSDNEHQVSGFGSQVSGFIGQVWVLSPLLIPLPNVEWARRFNGWLCARLARKWARRLGFAAPVLINYVPVLAGAMKAWKRASRIPHPESCIPNPASRISSPIIHHSPLIIHGSPVVYHCVDKWDAFDMYDSKLMAELDRQCCKYADVVIASSRDLCERCKTLNPNTHLVAHGVDWEHFAAAVGQTTDREKQKTDIKEDSQKETLRLRSGQAKGTKGKVPANVANEREWEMLNTKAAKEAEGKEEECLRSQVFRQSAAGGGRIRHPADAGPADRSQVSGLPPSDLPQGRIVGFFGLLSEWVDQDLLIRLAAELPEAQVVLIGKADVPIDKLRGRPNIHVLGPRMFKDLPKYVARFDVGIIPFMVNELTRAVNPIKLREMLSAGCPVVSTALPEVEELARQQTTEHGIFVARSHDEFIELVREVLAAPMSVGDRLALSQSMKSETWGAKVDEILQIIGST